MSKMKMWNMYYPKELIQEIKDLADEINLQNPGMNVTAATVARLALSAGLTTVRAKFVGQVG